MYDKDHIVPKQEGDMWYVYLANAGIIVDDGIFVSGDFEYDDAPLSEYILILGTKHMLLTRDFEKISIISEANRQQLSVDLEVLVSQMFQYEYQSTELDFSTSFDDIADFTQQLIATDTTQDEKIESIYTWITDTITYDQHTSQYLELGR